MVAASDAARAQAGCPALRVDPYLTTAARAHSEDMRVRRFYSHVNPDGDTPLDRASEAGYSAAVAENISSGLLRTGRQVVNDWARTPSERFKLLDCSYTAVGVGVEKGLLGSWWTLLLGKD